MERLRIRNISTVLALGLGLAACTSLPEESQKDTTIETATNTQDIRIIQTYTPTGKRITAFESQEPDRQFNPKIAYCDGPDLVEDTDSSDYNGGAAVRSVDHRACADGRLDETDFLPLDQG